MLLACSIVSAQVSQQWAIRYTGPGGPTSDDYGSDVAYDLSGNVYTAGWTSSVANSNDYIVIKYNSAGVQQWLQTYDGPGHDHDYALSIAVDASANVYITGKSYGDGTAFDYATIKYNTNGVMQWVQRYNSPTNDDDAALKIAVDGTGNVYVTGTSGADMATIKYNSAGVQQWVKRWNTTPNGLAAASNCLALDPSGNIFVTGWKDGISPVLGKGIITIKYDPAGNEVWVKQYIVNSSNIGNVVICDNAGNIYVGGKSQPVGGAYDYITIKYNTAGVIQWSVIYASSANSGSINSIAVGKTSGNVYVTGNSPNSGASAYNDYCTIKYNSAGAEQWVQRFNNSNPLSSNHYAYSMAIDTMENVYVTGDSPLGGEGSDIVTIKYNTGGTQQWMARYNGPVNQADVGNNLKVDAAGNVYVAGYSYGSSTNTDLVTIKYSQSTAVNPISSIVPDKYSLSQNFPNPFNPSTKINFEIPTSGNAVLKIFNSLGKEVSTIVNERLIAGKYSVTFNAAALSSGIYFYTLQAGEFVETKKMLLIK